MNRLIALATAAGAAMSLLSAGAAGTQGAPDVTGKKYSEAAAILKSAGVYSQVGRQSGRPTVAGRSPGDQSSGVAVHLVRPLSVQGWRRITNVVMLSLNCNAEPPRNVRDSDVPRVSWSRVAGFQATGSVVW